MIIEVKNRLSPFPNYPKDEKYFLIIPDHASGRPQRYTVYVIPPSPSGKIKVIGRNLTLTTARLVAKGKL